MPVNEIDPLHALAAYDIGKVGRITPAGGTAGKTWKVETPGKDYFLRLRGIRTSSEARLAFDHGLRDHLVANGVPTAATLEALDGSRWLRRDEGVFELYPFVEGRLFDPNSLTEVANAGRGLADYHRVASTYTPPSSEQEPIAQYTTLGFSDAVSDRMDDPHLQKANMLATRDLAGTADERGIVDRCLARADDLIDRYAGPAFDDLTGWVIHGDYTPANLLFSEAGDVAGIFDLDWALPGARCRDVADGLYFFATAPREIRSADIWSLTDAAAFDPDRCRGFLGAYQQADPLSAQELDAIPMAFAGRWLSIRLEGLAKVESTERFKFFSRGVEGPLRWLDRNWKALLKG